MPNPLILLGCVGKAAVHLFGGGVAGAVLVDLLPELANEAWKWWIAQRDPEQRRQDLAALARAAPAQIQQEVRGILDQDAADLSPITQQTIAAYLTLLPGQVRKSLRRPSDPNGITVPFELSPNKADDLLTLLPARLPRFQPGDHPLPGVDWQLEELLGVGGFGEVWKAKNPLLSSVPPVALKFCLDPAAARYLRNEAAVLDRVMRQGRHPGIVTLQHTYLSSDTPCLEYEFIAGGDLAGLIHEWHRLPHRPTPLEISRVLHQLALIVGFAHGLEPPIVHRDLKPANILVHGTPTGLPQLKVADFGIGGVASRHAITDRRLGTTRGLFLSTALRGSCTPLYASPQQMQGEPPDPADDVYALGVIWYQMLLGNLTLGRPGGTRWQRRLKDMGLEDQIIDVLSRCFEDDLVDRLPTALALADELGALLPSRRLDRAKEARSHAQLKVQKLTGTIKAADASPPRPDRKVAPPPRPEPRRDNDVREQEARRRQELQLELAELDRLIAASPKEAPFLARRAEIHRLLGDHDQSIRDATEAIRFDLALARAYSTRGSSYRMKGQLDLALADCSEAVRLDPTNVLALFNRGEVYRQRDQLRRAIADFSRAIELDPTYFWAWGARGAARQQQCDLRGALEDLNRTLALEPAYAWAYLVRAEILRLLGAYDHAIADCTEALRFHPENHTALATRGAAFRARGDFEAASADLREALRLNPDFPWASEQLELSRQRKR